MQNCILMYSSVTLTCQWSIAVFNSSGGSLQVDTKLDLCCRSKNAINVEMDNVYLCLQYQFTTS